MHQYKTYSTLRLLLLCLFFCVSATAASITQCDSLIKRGIDAMWKKDYVKSLELLTEARNIAEKNHWYKQQFLAINNIGANYYSLLDYGLALDYYLESYNLAVKQLEPKYEMVVLNNIAILYSKDGKYDKAKEYFKKAYDTAAENNDLVKVGLYAMNLGNVANEMKKPVEARAYFIESLPHLKQEPDLLILAEIGLAESDLLDGKTKQARNKATQLYASAKNKDFNDIGLSLLFIIAKSYLQEKNYALAANSAAEILQKNPNLETRKSVFELLSSTYTKSEQFNEALRYKDSVISVDKQLNDIKSGKLFETNKVKFEIENYKSQIAVNQEKLATERKLFYSIIAFIIAVVTIVILALRNRAAKQKQKQLQAEGNEKIMALQLEKEKNENLLLEQQIKEKETTALLEQERLKSEIESRNRKLSAKALYLSGRNELIEDILSSISGSTEISKNPEIAKHIKTLNTHLKTNDEWDSFLTHFEEVNQGFLNRLKTAHPSLNANDIRFLAYIYMNLSTKEIASMLNVTAEACRKRKERLATKMELPDSTTLYDYLSFI